MRVDESGIAVRQADEWGIVHGPGGTRTLIAEPRIHVNHTQVKEEHRDDDHTYRVVALDGRKFEAFLQDDGSVQVVVGDFRGTFADIHDAFGGREEVRKDLRSRQLSHMEIAKRYTDLARAHPQEWVAFHDGQLAALGRNRDDVLANIEKRRIRRSRVVIQFLDPEPKTWAMAARMLDNAGTAFARRFQAPVTSRSRVKKARLRGVPMAQFTGTFW